METSLPEKFIEYIVTYHEGQSTTGNSLDVIARSEYTEEEEEEMDDDDVEYDMIEIMERDSVWVYHLEFEPYGSDLKELTSFVKREDAERFCEVQFHLLTHMHPIIDSSDKELTRKKIFLNGDEKLVLPNGGNSGKEFLLIVEDGDVTTHSLNPSDNW